MPIKKFFANRPRDSLETPGFCGAMQKWYETALGQYLLDDEKDLLEDCLPRRFGYHLLQIGCSNLDMTGSSPIGHKITVIREPGKEESGIVARGEALPLANDSVDLVLLHHSLDFAEYQHQLLREVSRVLIAGGCVVVLGFNPYSIWGIRTRMPGRKKSPWQGRLLSTSRVKDWLKLLDFQVEQVRYAAYALPINSPAVIRYSGLLESAAKRVNWPTGGVYMISAKKQVLPLTPIQTPWRYIASTHVGLPIAENITRVSRELNAASNEEQ